jgi:hypothetical protein
LPGLSKAVAAQELNRRWQAAIAAFTPEAIADGHQFQLQALESSTQNLILQCSRRAGKTYLCCALLATTAVRAPGAASCLYLALTSGQAKKVWRKIWKPMCRRWKLCQPKDHNESELVTTFANGTTVQFGGTDDMRHVQSLLGDSMACGMAIIDECQSDPGLIERLVTDILGPMLDETTANLPVPGRLVLAGTVPPVAAGYFWDTWVANYDEEKAQAKDDAVWLPIGWGRADNPHETFFAERLLAYCRKYGLSESDSIVQRNWFGRRVFDADTTAYRYSRSKNGYAYEKDTSISADKFPPGQFRLARIPAGIDNFGIGIDPAATSDRMALVLWGWSSQGPRGLWHCAEWVTDRGANALESQYLEVIKWLVRRYNVVRIIRDAGSASTTLDPAFLADHGLVIEPAKKGKGSVKTRVERLKDLLGTGRAHIMIGSALEQDLQHAMFDQEKRAVGKYEWTAACHPDVADAASYAVVAYIEGAAKAEKPKQNPFVAVGSDEDERLAAAAWKQQPVSYGPGDEENLERFDDGSGAYGGPLDNKPVL